MEMSFPHMLHLVRNMRPMDVGEDDERLADRDLVPPSELLQEIAHQEVVLRPRALLSIKKRQPDTHREAQDFATVCLVRRDQQG